MALVETLLNVSSTGALLAALLLLLVIYFCFRSPEDDQEPPGPKPLPLVGNLHLLDLKQLHVCLWNLSKKYGSVFKVHLGPKKIVVLAGYKTVKQALVNQADEFGEREITPIFQDINEGHGIIFTNGDMWKTMRRFALSTLRDFGMGKKLSEEKIIQETRYLREVFETFKGNPFDTTQPVNYAASNLISAIVYGNRFEYDEPTFKEIAVVSNHTILMVAGLMFMLYFFVWHDLQIYNMFPVLRPLLKTWRLLMKHVESNHADIQVLVDHLRETFNPLDCRGLVDAFFIQKQSLEESGENDSQFNDLNLLMTVVNLFAAGTDTTGTTLRWGLLFMAKYPHIQDRVHEEIDRVLDGREPVTEDRKNLPYTDAVIHEIQRLANLVPLNLPHKTSCDVNFNGYLIKKGTCVLPLLYSVLRDESEWEMPNTFNPEHFLNENGQLIKRDAFMPFSAGRRICLGEGLARMELFLFFTSLLQCFHFTPPPGVSEDELDLTPVVGLVLNPSPHKLCAVSRAEKHNLKS
ncbi:cytochrome P450 2K1-like [Misgurnus anguillicaudatus]|uniref:cytochrome P450 2K1-like n=1 Tax=Misgurnus anguillicaudatus TaxID=75329 RepID=UPI003CCF53C7